MSRWPMVPLSQIATPIERVVPVEPGKKYRTIGVKWWGEGAYEREPIDGSETAARMLSVVRANDLIINKIWVRHGSTAIAGNDVDGCAASGEFPTFDLDRHRVTPRWLHWLTKTYWFWDKCDRLSQGTSGKNRIRPERFVTIEIPLPPLAEQHRLVERIDAQAVKIEEAKQLRRTATEETKSLFAAVLNELWGNTSGWKEKMLGQLITTVSGQVDPRIEPYASFPHINGESIESGTGRLLKNYRRAKEDGVTSGKYHFRPQAVLYSKIRPYLRKSVQVPFEGVCSADIYAFETISPELEPRFLLYSLIGPAFTRYANDLSGRTRMPKLNQNQLFAFRLSYPNIQVQRRMISYLDQVRDSLTTSSSHQVEVSTELDALLPTILDRAFRGEL